MGGLVPAVSKAVGESSVGRLVYENGLDYVGKYLGKSGEFLAKGLRKSVEDTNAMMGPQMDRILKSGMAPAVQKADALAAHKTARIIAETPIFGRKDTLAKLALQDIENMHGKAQSIFATDMFEKYLGRPIGGFGNTHEPLEYKNWEKNFRSLEAMHKLSLAPLSHIIQPLNQLLFLARTQDSLGGAFRSLSKTIREYQGGAVEYSLRSGATVNRAFDEIRRTSNPGNWMSKGAHAVLKPLDLFTDFQDRWAAYSGEEALRSSLSALQKNPNNTSALRLLTSLSDSSAAQRMLRSGATQDDVYLAMRRGREFIQAPTDVGHVPGPWLNTPIGRTMTMYRPFVYKQWTFLKRNVFEEAFRYKNYKPLLYFSLLYPLFSEVSQDVRSFSRTGSLGGVMGQDPSVGRYNRPSWEYPVSRLVDGMSQLGGLAIFTDTIMALGGSFGTPLGLVFGPPAGDLTRFYGEFGQPGMKYLEDAHRDRSTQRDIKRLRENTIKELLRAVPFIGPAASTSYKRVKRPRPWLGQEILEEGDIDKLLGTVRSSNQQ